MFAKQVFQLSLAHSGRGIYGTDQTLLQTAAGICPAPAPLGPGTRLRLRQPNGSAGETIRGSPRCLGPRAKAEANTGVLGGPRGVTSSSHSPLPNSKGLPQSLELPDLVSTHPWVLPMKALQVNFSILSLAWAPPVGQGSHPEAVQAGRGDSCPAHPRSEERRRGRLGDAFPNTQARSTSSLWHAHHIPAEGCPEHLTRTAQSVGF